MKLKTMMWKPLILIWAMSPVDDEQDKPRCFRQQSDDDIVIEEPDSDDHSLESLAAALGQVDAGDSDDDSDTAVTDDHEFDLGEIQS